ncbi:diadenylate cyclase [Sporomusa sp.]|uniref:diadenylate cyclase n=1 Tax=Sporomusa sp. TaxID=2078658 RepID=UPI002BB4D824|nr:diadenylate cyclase [Sporomusa sp.]HWR42582.1 diadenylate cyclase [Sporomusa sp.]
MDIISYFFGRYTIIIVAVVILSTGGLSMTECQLDEKRKKHLRDRLEEISIKTRDIVDTLDNKEGCLLCEITTIKALALELDELASFYHFQASFLPKIMGMDEISNAITELSAKGYGALIAVEQNDSLESYIIACNTTGTYIGAEVSALLLESIFFPGNPLHDGAVIVRDGRIASAGCVLPLSAEKYTKEGKKIGTRHRAALGLSECTDALILVVSEETRRVSVVQHGVLHPIGINMCEHSQSLYTPEFQSCDVDEHLNIKLFAGENNN